MKTDASPPGSTGSQRQGTGTMHVGLTLPRAALTSPLTLRPDTWPRFQTRGKGQVQSAGWPQASLGEGVSFPVRGLWWDPHRSWQGRRSLGR
jgi:hypothetical protein